MHIWRIIADSNYDVWKLLSVTNKEFNAEFNLKTYYAKFPPFRFWFNENPRLSLPEFLCSFPANTVRITVEFNDMLNIPEHDEIVNGSVDT